MPRSKRRWGLQEVIQHPWAALRHVQSLDALPDRRVTKKPMGPFDPTDPLRHAGRASATYRAMGLYSLEETRIELYENYREMDSDSMISLVLDAYGEDAGQFDPEHKRIVWCEADNKEIEKIVTTTMDRVKLDDLVFPIVRALARDGDVFEHMALARNQGVIALRSYDPWRVSRVEDAIGRLLGFAPADERGDPSNIEDSAVRFDQALHFRLQSRDRSKNYGVTSSFLHGSRVHWRELQLMEDQIVIQRLLRRPDRLMYLMDMTGMSYDEAWITVKEWERKIYREVYIDPQAADFRSQGIPLDSSKDFVLPRGANNQTQVTNFPATNTNDLMKDLDYMLRRLAAGIGFPLGFIGRGDPGSYKADQGLSRQFQPFAKRATRLQRSFLAEATRMCQIDLVYKGIDPTRAQNHFTLNMASVAPIVEIERAEIIQLRMDRMTMAINFGMTAQLDLQIWVPWVLEKYGGLPKDLIGELTKNVQSGAPSPDGPGPSGAPPPAPMSGAEGAPPSEAVQEALEENFPSLEEIVQCKSSTICITGVESEKHKGMYLPQQLDESTGRGKPNENLRDWDEGICETSSKRADNSFKNAKRVRAETRLQLVATLAGMPSR